MQQQRAVLGKKPLVAEIIPSFASRDGRAVKNPDAVDEDEDSHRLHRATSSKSTPGSTRAQKRVVLIPSHGVKRRKFEEEPEIISLHSSSGSDGEAQKGRPQSAVRKNLDDPASSARSRGRALSRGQDEENKINAVGAFQKRTPVSARGEQRNQQAFTSEAKSKGVGLAFNAFGGSTAFSSGAIEEPDAGSRSRVPPEPRTPARKTTPGNKRNRSESAAPRSAKAKASGSRSSARRPGAAKLQIVRDSFGRFVYDSLGEDELKRVSKSIQVRRFYHKKSKPCSDFCAMMTPASSTKCSQSLSIFTKAVP
ncbi:unnamed protein product [Amoebophrya sp. A25]|nr:unnamed protein product [Amoebophrya sp. A25]|eukprot:GSA25T00025144001.1